MYFRNAQVPDSKPRGLSSQQKTVLALDSHFLGLYLARNIDDGIQDIFNLSVRALYRDIGTRPIALLRVAGIYTQGIVPVSGHIDLFAGIDHSGEHLPGGMLISGIVFIFREYFKKTLTNNILALYRCYLQISITGANNGKFRRVGPVQYSAGRFFKKILE